MNTPLIRIVLAISIDGRLALPNGQATHLGGKEDRAILEQSLAWADGVLIGGGTLRAHHNTCLIHNNKLLEKRVSEGRSPQPTVVVVSSQKNISTSWPFFYQPIERWLINPKEISNQCPIPKGYERQFLMQASWSQTISQLNQSGLFKLVLLGGAQLIGSFLEADQIDEIQLTLTPKILGGRYTWVPTEIDNLPKDLSRSGTWQLKSNQLLNNDEVLLQYSRNHSSTLTKHTFKSKSANTKSSI